MPARYVPNAAALTRGVGHGIAGGGIEKVGRRGRDGGGAAVEEVQEGKAGSAADAGPSEIEQEGGPGGEGSPSGWGVGRSGGGALSGDVG